MALITALLFCLLIGNAWCVKPIVHKTTRFPIGGLFSGQEEAATRRVFENVAMANNTRAFWGRPIAPDVSDSYSVALDVCDSTTDKGVISALIDFRPTNGVCDNTCLLCNRLNITHLLTAWEPTETMANDLFTFNYYPTPEMVSKAYLALIKKKNWQKFSFLYEDDDSFIRAQEIINSWPRDQEPILFRKLVPNGDNRETFKYIFKVTRTSSHLLDCDPAHVAGYMREIMEIENATHFQSFILTSLDAHTLDLSEIPNFMGNMSTMHLTAAWDDKWQDLSIDARSGAKLEVALAADALNHLEKAIRSYQIERSKMMESEDFTDNASQPPPLCYLGAKSEYDGVAWPAGDALRSSLINTTDKGFSGNIQFDEEGKRTSLRMLYSNLGDNRKFNYVGYWDSTTDMIKVENSKEEQASRWKAGVIRVTSKIGMPYFNISRAENGTTVVRGFAVELVNAIFSLINENGTDFKVEFYKVPDDAYGNPIEGTNGRKWSGLVGELLEHKAELAICDLSITSERIAAVDFSMPFITTGISMLLKKPDPEDPDMFSFIKPLALDTWLYLATTYIIVSYILLICARMSQDDWVNPHPCNQNPESLQNIWSLYNCMWLTMGSIMTQGCDILPRGFGSRWVSSMWYFFAMIITASYTANMSTFISNSRRSNIIHNVKDLSEQTKVIPGAVTDASTSKFFEKSQDPVYQKIWSMMITAKPSAFANTNTEGMERVRRSKGNYAFFMESAAIEYYTQQHCDLIMVGPELDSKGYGIAMDKEFAYKGLVDKALLQLQESGKLAEMKDKWWTEIKDTSEDCKPSEDSDALEMKNTSGIFLVLGSGAVLGLIVAIVGFLLHVRKISIKERVSFKEALASEWRTSLDPRVLNKPVAPPRSAAPSESPPRERSQSRAVSVLRAATSFINFDQIY